MKQCKLGEWLWHIVAIGIPWNPWLDKTCEYLISHVTEQINIGGKPNINLVKICDRSLHKFLSVKDLKKRVAVSSHCTSEGKPCH